jgi:cytochrome bd-type quinol oxidase subunit 2
VLKSIKMVRMGWQLGLFYYALACILWICISRASETSFDGKTKDPFWVKIYDICTFSSFFVLPYFSNENVPLTFQKVAQQIR